MNRTCTMRWITVVALMSSVLSAKPVWAQWSATTYGVAEYDTKQTILLLAGLSAGPGGLGIKPRVGVQAYYLAFDVGSTRENGYVVKPFIGIANNYNGGSLSANVGYAFSNKTIENIGTGTALIVDRGQGVVVSGGWDYWGTGGPLGYQALASYNFDSEGLWTRGRVTTRVAQTVGTSAQTRVGAEVAYLHGKDYWGVQPGGVVEFHDRKGRILGLGAGAKFFEGNQNAAYFKVEGVLPLGR